MAAHLSILTANILGLKRRFHEFADLVAELRPSVVLLQETLLRSTQRANLPGYTLHRQDGVPPLRGVAIYCGTHLTSSEFPLPQVDLEAQGLLLTIGASSILLINIYLSPGRPLPSQDLQRLLHLWPSTVLVGDFNCHHTNWHCATSNARGRALHHLIVNEDLGHFFPNEPTYHPPAAGRRPSVLDFAITRGTPFALVPQVLHRLSSDHLPVLFRPTTATPCPPAMRHRNYKKADWTRYRERLDSSLQIHRFATKNDIDHGASYFTEVIQTAAAQSIPTSSQRCGLRLPEHLKDLRSSRDHARRQWQRTGLHRDHQEFSRLAHEFRTAIREHSSKQWTDAINEEEDYRRKLWRIAKCLRSSSSTIPALTTANGTVFSPEDKAIALAEASEVPLGQTNDPDLAAQVTDFVESVLLNADVPSEHPQLATPKEVASLITSLKPHKAPGEDGITAPLLRALSRKARVYFTMLINACLLLQHFPSSWKNAITIFLHKPGKDGRLPGSYRPISLLRLLAKILEKVIVSRLMDEASRLEAIPIFQHGFTPGKSTTTQLHRVIDEVVQHLNMRRSAVLVCLDLSKAFDSVWHHGLLLKLHRAGFTLGIIRILHSYLTGRTYQPRVGNSLGPRRPVLCGVPQGSVLGPHLFNLYTADIPTPPRTTLAVYADDTAAITASMNAAHARNLAQQALDVTSAYYRRWLLQNNAGKTAVMIFGKGSRRRPPCLTQDGTPIPWTSALKYLGVVLDPQLSFAKHVRETVRKARQARGALLPLVRCRGSLAPDLKLRLYNTCLRPILTYASPIWRPYLSRTSWETLQRFQNISVKHSQGLTKFASTTGVHEATGQKYFQRFCEELYEKHFKKSQQHLDADIRRRSRDAAPPLPGQLPRPAALAVKV